MRIPDLQSGQTEQSQIQKSRSALVSFGRFTERCRTTIWWRSARISSWRAARLRNHPENEAMRAVITGPNGSRIMRGKSHIISEIGIYENHKREQNQERGQQGSGSHVTERYKLLLPAAELVFADHNGTRYSDQVNVALYEV